MPWRAWTCLGDRPVPVSDDATPEAVQRAAVDVSREASAEATKMAEEFERSATPEQKAARDRNVALTREYERQLWQWYAAPVVRDDNDPRRPIPPAFEPLPA